MLFRSEKYLIQALQQGRQGAALEEQALAERGEAGEILMRDAKAMEALQKKENAGVLASIRGDVEKAWPGQVLGNPDGKITLVEFTDFACTYCRQSVADVAALIATKGFNYLKAPIELITPPHTPVPFSPTLETAWLPDAARIEESVRKLVRA